VTRALRRRAQTAAVRLLLATALTATTLTGCGGGAAPPAADPAETPQPGAAAPVDPGPPPAGQSEPPPLEAPGPAAPADQPSADQSSAGQPSADPTSAASPSPSNEPTSAAIGAVRLEIRDWAGVESVIADHKGKVVVVDLWSTSCPPCRREFPNLVKLQAELGPQVACVSVSADYDGTPSQPVESYREQVLEFLAAQQATFDNILCSQPAEDLFDALGVGSIPTVFVYDQHGKLARKFTGLIDDQEVNYADHIRPFVLGLMVSN